MSKKHNEIRWTGVCSAAKEHFEKVARGECISAPPKGLQQAALRLVCGAIAGADRNSSERNRSCFEIAISALSKLGYTRADEVNDILCDIRIMLESAAQNQEHALLAAKFFGQIQKTGGEQRYTEYIHGVDEEDDDE